MTVLGAEGQSGILQRPRARRVQGSAGSAAQCPGANEN